MKRGRREKKKIAFLSYKHIIILLYSDDVLRRTIREDRAKRIRSPRCRRRSYIPIYNSIIYSQCDVCMHAKEPFVIVLAAAKSCPVRNGIDLLKVGTSFVHVPGSIPAGIVSGTTTFGRIAKKEKKNKRFNTQNVYYDILYAYYTPTYTRVRVLYLHPFSHLIGHSTTLYRVFARPVKILIYISVSTVIKMCVYVYLNSQVPLYIYI